jgi:single-stranded-DNA-specific exonuclease
MRPPGRLGPPTRTVRDRRGEGFAGVAGDLLTSGEPVLVAVADAPRRRDSLERLVAGLAPGELALATWDDLLVEPSRAEPYAHLLALDPPPGVDASALAGPPGGMAHLAWGPPEVEFALAVWRAELDLRPPLVAAYRALRDAGAPVEGDALEGALAGRDRYPRSVACCARMLRVLLELELVAWSGRRCSVRHAGRVELERSPTYTACLRRLDQLERAYGAAEPRAPAAVSA